MLLRCADCITLWMAREEPNWVGPWGNRAFWLNGTTSRPPLIGGVCMWAGRTVTGSGCFTLGGVDPRPTQPGSKLPQSVGLKSCFNRLLRISFNVWSYFTASTEAWGRMSHWQTLAFDCNDLALIRSQSDVWMEQQQRGVCSFTPDRGVGCGAGVSTGQSAMRLSITSTTGSPVELMVPRGDTVEGLRTRIAQKLRLQTEKFVLLHNDRWVFKLRAHVRVYWTALDE